MHSGLRQWQPMSSRMATLVILFLICLAPHLSPAQTIPPALPRLTAIVSLPNYKAVCLEVADTDPRNLKPEQVILEEGEEIRSIEVLRINSAKQSVEVLIHQTNMTLRLEVKRTAPTQSNRLVNQPSNSKTHMAQV